MSSNFELELGGLQYAGSRVYKREEDTHSMTRQNLKHGWQDMLN